jgi:SAM-dependent methyltransferase
MADPETTAFAREWNRTLAEQDVNGAAALRAEDYRIALPQGNSLDRAQELALLGNRKITVKRIQMRRLAVQRDEDRATITIENRLEADLPEEQVRRLYRYTLACRKEEGRWQALEARLEELDEPDTGRARRLAALRRLAGRAARRLRGRPPADLPRLAWLPFRPGEDYILPPPEPRAEGESLAVPPEALWTDARYSAHGAAQVAAMLAIVEGSGLAFRDGDRILDLGCGPGRMIRHLLPLAERCEIWGADISAESILWCQRHLSPPFHFATTTKLPHLPFADGSFRFVYCGSLFTHIDDLADAWLLELRRILAPDGRLYLTLHDNCTVELLGSQRYIRSAMARALRGSATFAAARDQGFAMFTIGRDDGSQVFYDRDWFARRAAPSFEILSVTEEAYYYQTAYLLKPKR